MSDTTDITQLVLRERQGRDAAGGADAGMLSPGRGHYRELVIAARQSSWPVPRPLSNAGSARASSVASGGAPSPGRAVLELPAAIEVRDVFEGVDADLVSFTDFSTGCIEKRSAGK